MEKQGSCIGIILVLVVIGLAASSGSVIVVFAALIGLALVCIAVAKAASHNPEADAKKKELEELREKLLPRFRRHYDVLCRKHHMPEDCALVNIGDTYFHCWADDGVLRLFTYWPTLSRKVEESLLTSEKFFDYADLITIPIQDIRFFMKDGEVFTETRISGGGGGGISYSGAIIGGLIAGDAGAIIGSRKPIEPVKTKTMVHDDRKVILYFSDGDGENLSTLSFDHYNYQTFLQIIPEKEYSYVLASQAVKTQAESANSIELRMKRLHGMKMKQLISQEDFELQKLKLLDEI